MIQKVLFLSVAASLMIAGCQHDSEGGTASEGRRPVSPTTDGPSPNGQNGPVTAEKPQSSPQGPQKGPTETPTAKSDESTTSRPARPSDIENPTVVKPVIKPAGTDGWTALAQTTAEFGQMVDRAVASLENVAGTFEIELRNEVMEGNKTGKFLIASPNQYAIETVDIQKPTVPNRTLADGKSKKVLTENGWSAPQSVETKGKPVASKVSDELTRNFTRLIFESLTEKRPTWTPILAALEAEGFDVKLETKNIATSGVMKPYTRLLAARSGNGLNQFEVRFDGIRHVPLTIRMVATGKSGKPVTSQWRARWQFNQKVSDEIAKM